MKVTRRRGGGGPLLRLDPVETSLLSSLVEDLVATLEGDLLDPDDPVRARLYPAGYTDDTEAAAEFRQLTESGLTAERVERGRLCLAELGAPGDIPIADDAGRRWIQTLNDLRLALGTRLGITEEDDPAAAYADGEEQARAVYYWLTAVQDSLVRALMR